MRPGRVTLRPALRLLDGATLLVALLSLAPSLALACPYASAGADGCASCGASSTSLFSYGAWLILGIGLGISSVALERDRH
jgi:hypothetical protein